MLVKRLSAILPMSTSKKDIGPHTNTNKHTERKTETRTNTQKEKHKQKQTQTSTYKHKQTQTNTQKEKQKKSNHCFSRKMTFGLLQIIDQKLWIRLLLFFTKSWNMNCPTPNIQIIFTFCRIILFQKLKSETSWIIKIKVHYNDKNIT